MLCGVADSPLNLVHQLLHCRSLINLIGKLTKELRQAATKSGFFNDIRGQGGYDW